MDLFGKKANEALREAFRQLEEVRSALEMERMKRMNAEALASMRLKEADAAREQALRFERDAADARNERMKSLDAVNMMFLRGVAPEAQQETAAVAQQQLTQQVRQHRTPLSQLKKQSIREGIAQLVPPPKTVQ